MSEAPVVLTGLLSSGESSTRFSWRYASRHFDDLGSVRVGIYGFVRDLIPALVMTTLWFLQERRALYTFPKMWQTPRLSLLDVVLLAVLTLCWRMIAGSKMASGSNLVRKQAIGNLIAAPCCAIVVFFASLIEISLSRSLLLSLYFLLGGAMVSLLWLCAACVTRWAILTFVVEKREVILLGSGPRAQELFPKLMESSAQVVTGIVDEEFIGTAEMRPKYMGGIDELEHILKEHPIQVVYCSLPIKTMYAETQRAISICEQFGIEVRHSARIFNTGFAHVDAHASAHGIFAILSMVRKGSRNYAKRIIDIVGASTMLILTAPILAASALAIKLSSPGPVFFAQERYGTDRRRFRMFKLRTMVANAEVLQSTYESMNELTGPVFKIRGDPRVIPVGRFLRSTSIDELPQLWNVLKGDMSLVGPRPPLPEEVEQYVPWQRRRLRMRPGLTCLWAVSGRDAVDFETWMRLDMEYIDNWSLALDWKILLLTIPQVLSGKGAH
jgi:exopolysaccharide biosynthesis polyprenyl glycosylphosphotransferase